MGNFRAQNDASLSTDVISAPFGFCRRGHPPQHVTFAREKAFVASGDDGTVLRYRLGGELVRQSRVPPGSYNVTFGWDYVISPSLARGTLSVLDRNGSVRAVRKVARAAHDACIVYGP